MASRTTSKKLTPKRRKQENIENMNSDWIYGHGKCADFESCAASKRIEFVMQLFTTHFIEEWNATKHLENEFVDIMAQCVCGDGLEYCYSVMAMLDDLEHLRTDCTVFEELKNCPMKDDGHFGLNGVDPKQCVGEMVRRHRPSDNGLAVQSESKDSHFGTYLEGLEWREFELLQICCKIHCVVNHSYRGHDDQDTKTMDDDDDGEMDTNTAMLDQQVCVFY